MSNLTIRCVITDDEPLASKGLLGYAAKTGLLQVVAVCEDAVQLNTILKQQPVDLLFLDIEMPYITGIDFLKSYPSPPKVIFTTAYERYAMQGFELDVLDYLLKPISFERFLKATNKAYDYFAAQQTPDQAYFFIRSDKKLEKVLYRDILFAAALENYVAIYTADRKIITHTTLKSVQEALPAQQFIQPHKSYLVNIQHISAIEGNILHMGTHQLPISKYQKEALLEKIVNNRLLKK
ncbi:LytR/AlgR family response regulator transcription factor [Chitinophaga nivalis]|uniref:LytTR family DNA-binding domain-containing protein n=1 Tax=Chitinophaga nivalis TaxID=2991709 RepID=A0ABT3IJG3_9BACT|nr:LytTR family DNA-binding domain-containing protein [Chitinophaga nivalis]MCW3466253.1 LytTR family DNA-binding domain-containing protein [Chitinophaga nivalis]MCW3484056.1 LytTR family DNA-binding domain-containing protein [Chitinophaga nivalis]